MIEMGLLLGAGLLFALASQSAGKKSIPEHLKTHVYREDFEQGELNAWASYPPNQDTAYDPYIYPGKITADEAGKCLVVKMEPPWPADQILGAVKLLDIMFDRDFSLRFRYYLKTVDSCPELRVHLPLADRSRLIYSHKNPPKNQWAELVLTWDSLAAQGLVPHDINLLRLTAVAVTAHIPKADPSMPIFLGIDDIEIRGLIEKEFVFVEPEVASLAEWQEKIPLRHYRQGSTFRLTGTFDFSPDRVTLTFCPLTDRNRTILTVPLTEDRDHLWKTKDISIEKDTFPPGLYLGTITAGAESKPLSVTRMTLFVEPRTGKREHPRVLFDPGGLSAFRGRLLNSRFRPVLDRFLARARSYREEIDITKIVFDIDQFPEQDWVVSLPAWYRDRFMAFREGLFTNAIAHLSGQDESAAPFIKALLLQLAGWPQWNHPWMEARGFHTYYPLGEFSDAFAIAYDTIYDLLTEQDRQTIRRGLLRNYIIPAYETYIVDNQVTSNSSNWLSHIAGGALISLMAIIGDDPDLGDFEPWLSGFVLKEHKYISTVFGPDGSYGEGFRYYNFAMQSFARTLPALERLFGIDLSGPLLGSHQETIWAAIVPKNTAFGFGDTESYFKQEAQAWWIGTENGPMNSWAWLLERSRDPSLAWLYHSLKEFDTLQEVLHETGDIPASDPSALGSVRFFPDVGTAVFKSGWREEDFIFVFRSGPFFNHQHLDQGSFYLADRGEIFLEERYDGEHHYYDDPVYRTHAIQPISHNTILLNRNPQSQKVGDPKGFAPGMGDQARLSSWLDTPEFAFVSGDLEKVYIEKLTTLRRNALYIKPRTVLLVDEIVPADEDVEVSLLFHTRWKKDITAGQEESTITKGGAALHIYHLAPEGARKELLTEPHFLYQYAARPLIERGYLQVSHETNGRRLIFANLMAATADSGPAPVDISKEDGSIVARVFGPAGQKTVGLSIGTSITWGDWSSDALILATGPEEGFFMGRGTVLRKNRTTVIESERPLVCWLGVTEGRLEVRGYLGQASKIILTVDSKPRDVRLNGEPVSDFSYDSKSRTLRLFVPAGPFAVAATGEKTL